MSPASQLAGLLVSLLFPAFAAAQVQVDVLVYGGTASGVMASAAAAREGASVVLLEPGTRLGGMVSGGLGATDVGNAQATGGDTLAFFRQIGKHYGTGGGTDGPGWRHEPHVAERLFRETAKQAGVDVRFSSRLREGDGVARTGGRITSVTTAGGERFVAKVYVDASYEGDLMAQSGVRFVVGRESVATYGEERAGIRPPVKFGRPGSARDAKGLIPDVIEPTGKVGDGDDRIMSYTFRLCLTRDPKNRVPFTRPADYDARRYELVLLELAKKPDAEFGDYVRLNELPNGKVDANNRPGVIVSTNLPNGSWGWPNGSAEAREKIWKEHESYLRGFYWFMQSDPRVSQRIRDEAKEWGLAADEFTESGNWPAQIYVRVARRMVGAYVTTANDLTTQATKPDSVGMGSYFMDSHRVARVVLPDGDVGTEGGVGGKTVPYQIAYRSLTPRREECENLLVPVCLSSSAVAICSLRMEPVYMILGQSAGTAAAIAAKRGSAVQDVDYEALKGALLAKGQVLALDAKKTAAEPKATAEPKAAANAEDGPNPLVDEPKAAVAPMAAAPAQSPATRPALAGIKGQPPEDSTAPDFFPAFDTYGQYVHRDWPGKIKSDADLKAAAAREEASLRQHAGPAEWNEYGGWLAGPTLDATGFFRTAKHDGRWWLVDPAGKLFFSTGMNCVRKMDPTPTEGREHFFADLPAVRPEFAPFVVRDVAAIKGAFAGKTPLSFAFAWSNLYRKFGSDWDAQASALAHRRMRSWGFNTIGNWSNEPTYLMRRTPYTANLRVFAPSVKVPNGAVKDPFDPALKRAVVAALAEQVGKTNGDPWCLGYFVDNEIPWSTPASLGEAVLKSPAAQPAKRELVEVLRQKYASVDGLNAAWRTEYKSWDELLSSVAVPEQASDDLIAFRLHLADAYFRTVKAAFVESGTKHLYLGSRIHGRQDAIVAVAARHCDVVSVNAYRRDVAVYADLGAPMMVTEFSFGATDRGMFYGGPQTVATQAERAALLGAFARDVRRHPAFVGFHWFQYQDQPASGRTREGENGAYGFVDIADNPAEELIRASRDIAAHMYRGWSAAE